MPIRMRLRCIGMGVIVLLLGFAFLTNGALGQGTDLGNTGDSGGTEEVEEKVWLTNATLTYGHMIDAGIEEGFIPAVNLVSAASWLKLKRHPTAPSVPWTELIGNPDNPGQDIFTVIPATQVYKNGHIDTEILFPFLPKATSTTGVELQPIPTDGASEWGTILDIRTWKWATITANPLGGAPTINRGPVISTDSVAIPHSGDLSVAPAGIWDRGTVAGKDSIFVRFVYANDSIDEHFALRFYLYDSDFVPVRQRIQPTDFGFLDHTATRDSAGLRTWFLEIDFDSALVLDGNYFGFVEMVTDTGEVLASAEVDIPALD